MAKSLPEWCQGRWQARSLISNPGALGFEQRQLTYFVEKWVQGGRLDIGPDRVAADHIWDEFLEGIGTKTIIKTGTLHDLFAQDTEMHVYGDPQPIKLRTPVSYAHVTFQQCKTLRRGAPREEHADATELEYHSHCNAIDIFRYPDDQHIAINPGDVGWIVYSRIP